jgi:CheY-like chemotaxis protein
MKVLIVDDELQIIELVSRVIRCKWTHFEVTQQNDWTEAVFSLERGSQFDLVITDLRIPGGREGLSVIKAVRENPNPAKIILMSGDATEADLQEAMPDKFLPKPFPVGSLIAAIEELLPNIESRPT